MQAKEWAATLGLVPVPLFPPGVGALRAAGEHTVLLDGARASFILSVVDGGLPELAVRSWAWSSNLAHHITIDPSGTRLVYQRWDDPRGRTLRAPTTIADRLRLLASMEKAPKSDAANVVLHVLKAFRYLRQVVEDPDAAVRVLNTLLTACTEVERGRITKDALLNADSVDDLLKLLRPAAVATAGAEALSDTVRRAQLGLIPSHIVNGNQLVGVPFDAQLFLRHAASELYQEAHRETEHPSQESFVGLGPVRSGLMAGTRDARFTPPSLGRLIVERTIEAIGLDSESVSILDPACGSGVFLQEALRELIVRRYSGQVNLHGFDISPSAVTISHFVMAQVVDEARQQGIEVTFNITQGDALLEREWPSVDAIMMNPPFQSWEGMSEERREIVTDTLGGLAKKRPDLAMAFIWKAVCAVKIGGAVGTVLPAPLLATQSGGDWRTAIANACELRVIGKLGTSTYFRGAMVEPAFLVARRTHPPVTPSNSMLVVTAAAGHEDAALRHARIVAASESAAAMSATTEADVYRVASPSSHASWMPRTRRETELAAALAQCELPTVESLFEVRQGVIPGVRKAFVLNPDDFERLPSAEREFFRPAIVNASVFDGQISDRAYVFYPYHSSGPRLLTEADLNDLVPNYRRDHLNRHLDELKQRKRMQKRWWLLTEHRAWERTHPPRIVSTYFGDQGSFGLDAAGKYVVVQGYAWFWRQQGAALTDITEDYESDLSPMEVMSPADVIRGSVGYAYLALLNSRAFSRVLALVSPRVAGGQYNLSARFVAGAHVPDLASDAMAWATHRLAELGRSLVANGLRGVAEDVDEAAIAAYGVDPDLFAFSR